MTRLISACLVLLLLSIISCKKDSNPVGATTTDQILPLKTGNKWVLHYTSFDTAGTATSSGYDTLVVGRDTTIGSEKWFQLGDQNYFWTNRSDGLWRQRAGTSTESPQLIFKYPGNANDTWTVVESSISSQLTLAATAASTTVPLGAFSCYFYHTRRAGDSYDSEDDYLKPGVGIVAWELFSKRSSGLVYRTNRAELISYMLN